MFGIQGEAAYPLWMCTIVINMMSIIATLSVRQWNNSGRFGNKLETATFALRYFTPVLWMVSCVFCILIALAHAPIAWPMLIVSTLLLLYMFFLSRRGILGVYSKVSSH